MKRLERLYLPRYCTALIINLKQAWRKFLEANTLAYFVILDCPKNLPLKNTLAYLLSAAETIKKMSLLKKRACLKLY
jgi:hypothetical protein